MKSDLKSHSVTEAHLMAKAKMNAFLQKYTQPEVLGKKQKIPYLNYQMCWTLW